MTIRANKSENKMWQMSNMQSTVNFQTQAYTAYEYINKSLEPTDNLLYNAQCHLFLWGVILSYGCPKHGKYPVSNCQRYTLQYGHSECVFMLLWCAE